MNWFERHLNWTELLIMISGLALYVLVSFTGWGFNIIAYSIEIPVEIHIYIVVALLFTLLLYAAGMLWVFIKKRRNLWFFLPVIMILVFPIIYYYLPHNLGLPNRSNVLLHTLILMIIFPLLWLGNLLVILTGTSKPNRYKSTYNFLRKLRISPQKSLVTLVYICLVIIILFSGLSFYRINCETREFSIEHYEEEEPGPFKTISLDIPHSFENGWDQFASTRPVFGLRRVSLFGITNITLSIQLLETEPTPINDYIFENYGYYCVLPEIPEINVKSLFIEENVAEYATFRLSKNGLLPYPYNSYSFVRLVRFERNGYIWTIECLEENHSKSNHAFDTLIESLKITG